MIASALDRLFWNVRLLKFEKGAQHLVLHPIVDREIEIWAKFPSRKRFYCLKRGDFPESMRRETRVVLRKLEDNLGCCCAWGTRAIIYLNFRENLWEEEEIENRKYQEWLKILAHEIAHIFHRGHDYPFPLVEKELLKFMIAQREEGKVSIGRKASFILGFELDFYDRLFFKELFEGLSWKAVVSKNSTYLIASGHIKRLISFLDRLKKAKGIRLFYYDNNLLFVPRKQKVNLEPYIALTERKQ